MAMPRPKKSSQAVLVHSVFDEQAASVGRSLAAGQMPLAGQAAPVLQQTEPAVHATVP